MQIKIHNYEILNFDEYSLIGSEKGICRVKSKQLRTAFQDIQAFCDTPIEQDVLTSILNKHKLGESARSELHKNLVIETDLPELYFEKIYILHGWKELQHQTTQILDQESQTQLTHLPLHHDSIQKITNPQSLVVMLPGSQNTNELKSLYFSTAAALPTSFIVAGYFSPNSFTVTQPYSPDLGNPCLFCSISRAIHFETQGDGSCTWTAILKFCTSNSIDLPNPKISVLHHAMVAGLIAQKIRALTSHTEHKLFQDNILTNSTICFNNGVISEEILPHWHMCDCLRTPHVKYPA